MRALTLGIWLAASAAFAQGARLAVHPLELRELTAQQREVVQAQFDVLLARIPGIRLAGGSAIEEALLRPGGRGCETRDECLRFLAATTESLYAVYARLQPDPLGAELRVSARVVRADGAVVRKADLVAPLVEGMEPTESAHRLLVRLLEALDLPALSPTVGVAPVGVGPRPELFAGPITPTPDDRARVRRSFGFALLGAGVATGIGGGVLAGFAAIDQGRLTPDATGAVPPAQAIRALGVAQKAQVATVLIPVGVVLSVLGGALAVWPSSSPPISIAVLAGGDRGAITVEGVLP